MRWWLWGSSAVLTGCVLARLFCDLIGFPPFWPTLLTGGISGTAVGKWAGFALARAQGAALPPDPVERLVMRWQLRRQERQLR